MPAYLEEEEFSDSLAELPEVQAFFCGTDRWSRDVAEWIKGPLSARSARRSMAERGNRVWLYWHPDGRLVGFSSLGETQWSMPPGYGATITCTVIPFLGLQHEFQGEPRDVEKSLRFSRQIMGNVLGKCLLYGNRDIVLMVHKKNLRAQKLYTDFGFLGYERPDKRTNMLQMHRTTDGIVVNQQN
jgi:hypothetical protein